MPLLLLASTAMLDMEDATGVGMTDIYSSMSATGVMGDTTPDPNKMAMGRSNPGRSGPSEGQIVADEVPPIADNKVAMPNRMSSTPGQGGADDKRLAEESASAN